MKPIKKNKCPACGSYLCCPRCTGSAGGKKSKRKITEEQQDKMQRARSSKKTGGE